MQEEEPKQKRKLPRIRDMEFSPSINPLMEPRELKLRRKFVRSGVRTDLTDPKTGEITHAAMIHEVQEKDDAEFVKVFAAGVKAIYDLSRTAGRVFQAILDEYQSAPMHGGYADSIYLVWFDGGLSGRSVGMSESTFNRGLRELLEKGFLAPKTPNLYWVNANLFFKGDRVMLIREYVRRKSNAAVEKRTPVQDDGQARLSEI